VGGDDQNGSKRRVRRVVWALGMSFFLFSISDVLGLGSGPQARQAQPRKGPAQPSPVAGPVRAQGWA
jgi:hypothetical protein